MNNFWTKETNSILRDSNFRYTSNDVWKKLYTTFDKLGEYVKVSNNFPNDYKLNWIELYRIILNQNYKPNVNLYSYFYRIILNQYKRIYNSELLQLKKMTKLNSPLSVEYKSEPIDPTKMLQLLNSLDENPIRNVLIDIYENLDYYNFKGKHDLYEYIRDATQLNQIDISNWFRMNLTIYF